MAYCRVWTMAFLAFIADGFYGQVTNGPQSSRCKSPTMVAQRIEKAIESCQGEIKSAILKEALEILGETTREIVEYTAKQRTKRDLFNEDEQKIAGCLLQCVYKKVKAVDAKGYPTVDGLIKLYAEGITDRGYFLATAQAVQQCLYVGLQQIGASNKTENSGSQMCDLAYRVFDCVSDQLTAYCSGA